MLNFRDFLFAVGGKDIAESITWDLLPLGATTPAEAVQFMRVDSDARAAPAIDSFLEELRKGIESVERAGGDTGRIYTYYDVNLHNKKQASAADLSVAVNQSAEGKAVTHTYDPNTGHPWNATALLEKVNAKRKTGRTLNAYDRDAAVWFGKLKEDKRYAWKHDTAASHVYSNEAVAYLASRDDAHFDEARKHYKSRDRPLR
ncbi:hypothetical protein GCM10010910_24260 [Microbacterium nanhaiense]|uniref:EC042-2821-like Restriction Endonuclease-like domain-containing protein n=1 Tax=Microbacterium nanhaiense TaxID=1301026 RepID=A0ABQ2N2C7_9MICO|nr:hypothetical protein [Microbacterium nanhaiense]GGO65941.1 hypothetical protein GCM10010910_24260 [Microbacterium nanhaiense]